MRSLLMLSCAIPAGWPEVLSLVLWAIPYAALLLRAVCRGRDMRPPTSFLLRAIDNQYTVSLVLQLYRSSIAVLTGFGYLAVPFVILLLRPVSIPLVSLRALHALNEPYSDLRLCLAVTALLELPAFFVLYTRVLHAPSALLTLAGFSVMNFAIQAVMARWRRRAHQAALYPKTLTSPVPLKQKVA